MKKLAAITVLALAALSGCAIVDPGEALPGNTSEPAGSNPPSAKPVPIVMACNLMLTDTRAADLSLKPIPNYSPAAGSLGAQLVALGGRACAWGPDTAASVEVVAAIPNFQVLRAARKSAATEQEFSVALTDGAYFEATNGTGRAQLFVGSWWIEISSATFATADDADSFATPLVYDFRRAGG